MPEADRMLGMYLHLARASQSRRQPMIRDKLLVLAGVQAEEMGLEQISALCRHRILAHNAQHLVRQWPTFDVALADEHFQSYLKQLKRRYSPEKIEHIVHSLGIELGRERDAYFSDLEYAAALLDTKPDSIEGILANGTKKTAVGQAGDRASNKAVELRAAASARPQLLPAVMIIGVVVVLALTALAVWLAYWRGLVR